MDPWEQLIVVAIGADTGDSIAMCGREFHAAQVWALKSTINAYGDAGKRFASQRSIGQFEATGRSIADTALAQVQNTEPFGIDDWAVSNAIGQVDLLLIDTHTIGLAELEATQRLLQNGCKAIHCRVPWTAANSSCAGLAEVSRFFQNLGFELYQIHETLCSGLEKRVVGLEGLWLHRDLLAHAASLPAERLEITAANLFRRLLERCSTMGYQRVAIYGAGKDLRMRAAALAEPPVHLDCIIDDSAKLTGTSFMKLPIVPLSQVAARGVDCIVVCSSGYEDSMIERCSSVRTVSSKPVAVVPVHQSHPRLIGRHPLIRPQHQAQIPAPSAISELEAKTGPQSPLEVFHNPGYLNITAAQLRHLASLKLDEQIRGRSVLEVGAGIGDLTGFFADRGCSVLATDVRPANVAVIRERFAAVPTVRTGLIDLEYVPAELDSGFDVVFCYGVLYHLEKPAEALAAMSRLCRGTMIISTCVSFGEHEAINLIGETASDPSQAARGTGCRPTRPWVLARLQEHFEHVYMPVTQPKHPEFPLDWTSGNPGSLLHRAVFIASREPIDNPRLGSALPTYQCAE